MTKGQLITYGALGVAGWLLVRKGFSFASMGLGSAQNATTDALASLSGLEDYENALLNANTTEEVRAIQEAWKNRPWWKRII